MSKHTTPLPHADQTGLEAAKPAPRASRFDERGIALQTVIIMVVLLAIAGGIAAVLLSRGQAAEEELRNTAVGVNVYTARTSDQCARVGGNWSGAIAAAGSEDRSRLQTANNNFAMVGWIDGAPVNATGTGVGFCKP